MKELAINTVSEKFEVTKKLAGQLVESVIETLIETLKTNKKAKIPSVGTLTIVEKSARKGRNPRTGETIDIPSKKTLKFTPTKDLKQTIQ